MRRTLFSVPGLVCWMLTGVVFGQTLSPQVKAFVKVDSPVVALTHVRVIDGTGGPARDDQTIILRQGKIESISDAASANIPQSKDAQVLDLHGYTVMPGLVGMHDHMFYPMGNGISARWLIASRAYISPGASPLFARLARSNLTRQLNSRSRSTPGKRRPHIHVTGPYLEGAESWALQMHELTGPDDATKTVNFWLDQGVDNFKAYMFITPDELRAAVIAAHKRGAKITGHLCSIGFREAADLGIDDLEHGLFVDTEFSPDKKPGKCPEDSENPKLMAQLDVNSGTASRHDSLLGAAPCCCHFDLAGVRNGEFSGAAHT